MRYEASCHCGDVAYAVEGEFTEGMDCNCSMCRRRGALLAFVPREKLELKTPAENLSLYTFNRHVIRHYFCGNCGIAVFGEGNAPDGTAIAAVNLRCIPAIDLDSLEIRKVDGASY